MLYQYSVVLVPVLPPTPNGVDATSALAEIVLQILASLDENR